MKIYTLKLKAIKDETADAYTLVFDKPNEPEFQHKAGQYLTLKVNVKGENLRRSFSLSSSPITDKDLEVTIKRIQGGKVSNHLRDTLKAGDTIEVLPPLGNFSLSANPNNKFHYVLIGAGSGITPLMSMIKTILKEEPMSKITLWYGNTNQRSIIFRDTLNTLQNQFNNRLNIIHFLSKPEENWCGLCGRLDKETLTTLVHTLFMNDEYKKLYYICGPEEMMKTAISVLDEQGVYKDNIFREYYSAPAPTDEEAAKIHTQKAAATTGQAIVLLDGKTYNVHLEGDEYVLDALINAGIDPPYSCQAGVCTTCRALLTKGKIEMDTSDGLTDYEIKQGYILTCQSRCIESPLEMEYK